MQGFSKISHWGKKRKTHGKQKIFEPISIINYTKKMWKWTEKLTLTLEERQYNNEYTILISIASMAKSLKTVRKLGEWKRYRL